MSWGITYEQWEQDPLPATHELVRTAMAHERDGWPMPISGDDTRRAWA